MRHLGSSFLIPFPVATLVSRVGQQRDIARAFDCLGQHALMDCAIAGNSPGQNLAALGDEISQKTCVLEIDDIHLLNAETADTTPAHPAATAPLLGPAAIVVIVAVVVVAASSVFVICRHS